MTDNNKKSKSTSEAPDPYDPKALRLEDSSSLGVRRVLTAVPCERPNPQPNFASCLFGRGSAGKSVDAGSFATGFSSGCERCVAAWRPNQADRGYWYS